MLSVLIRCLGLLSGSLLPLALAAQITPAPVAPVSPGPAPNPLWLEQQLRESAVLGQHHVGLCLADAATGQQLFGYHERQYFTPASTTKLLSLYAGLTLLPADSLLSLRYVLRPDTLLFWGTGDPTLLHGDVPSRRAFEFLQSRPEKLCYADVPAPPAFGPGWSWDDYSYYFQPERSALPIYGNTVRFHGRPGQAPRVLPAFFRPFTLPAPPSLPNPAHDHVRRLPEENRFLVFPAPRNWVDEVPFRTSSALLRQLLQDTLRRPVLAAGPLRLTPRDSVRSLRGLPADSLYRRMLRVSDNFLAEQLLLMCSAALAPDSLSPAHAIRVMQLGYLRTLPDAPQWVDGSGLSRLNLLTPRALTALLVRLHQQVPEPRLLSLLAAGGGPGTLRRAYLGGKSGPWLWGKTGTLSNTHNLAGYLRTRSGRLVAFTFFNNGYVVPTADLRREMERLLTLVREQW